MNENGIGPANVFHGEREKIEPNFFFIIFFLGAVFPSDFERAEATDRDSGE